MSKRAFFVALLLAAPVAAQVSPPRTPPVEVRREANRLLIDNAPTPLLFARGVVPAEDYDAYNDAGFNTVVVLLREASDEAVAQADAELRRAQERGFYLLLVVSPRQMPPASPYSDDYRSAVRDFVQGVGKLRAFPRLVGWVIEAVSSDSVPEYDADFIHYLTDRYGSLEALSAAWEVEISNWRQVTPAVAAAIDARRPGAIGRAGLDLAQFRRTAYRDLLSLWARELRIADPVHALFAGAVRDFRAIVSVPSDYTGIVTELQPHLSGGDAVTHSARGVDMARRGGRMAPLPTLSTAALPGQLTDWMRYMALHGACGIAFDSWADLALNDARRRAIRAAIDALTADGLLPSRSQPAFAVLYEPFHPGPGVAVRGSYGYLTNPYPGPAALFARLGYGTRFGLVDFLSQEDVTRVALDAYAMLLAPQAYALEPAERQALAAYVARGGRLAADLGIGCYEAGGSVAAMPADLRDLFGVPAAYTVDDGSAAFWTNGGARFPALGTGLLTRGDGPQGMPFRGPVAYYNLPYPDLLVLVGESFEVVFTGVIAAPPRGDGLAVFGMTWLWQYWLPGDPVFDTLHTLLVGERARGLVLSPARLVSDVVFVQTADGRVAVWNRSGEMAEVSVREAKVYQCPLVLQETPVAGQAGQRLIFPGQRLWVGAPLAATLESETPARVEVMEFGPERVRLRMYGTGSSVRWTADGWTVQGGDYTRFTLTVRDGEYRVPLNSRHRIQWQRRRGGEWESAEVTAQGRVVTHEFRSRSGEIIIEPLPETP